MPAQEGTQSTRRLARRRRFFVASRSLNTAVLQGGQRSTFAFAASNSTPQRRQALTRLAAVACRYSSRRRSLQAQTTSGFSARHRRLRSAQQSRHHEFSPERSSGLAGNAPCGFHSPHLEQQRCVLPRTPDVRGTSRHPRLSLSCFPPLPRGTWAGGASEKAALPLG